MIDVSKLEKYENPLSKTFEKTEIQCNYGIFQYLQKLRGNNPYLSKEIDVETSTVNTGEIRNLFDHFRVSDPSGSFIIFDFKDKKVNIIKYYFSVPTSSLGHSDGQPKTWIIEGSNDKYNWVTIDKQENDSKLRDYDASNTYSIENTNDIFYRFIRIKEIADQYDRHFLLLSEVEFYGSILSIK